MIYTVGQLAGLAGVTVRTLHHYDRIGLLVPEQRSGSASYRRYGPGSVERLHRILSYRELGLRLDDIAALLDDRGVDRLAHLRRQERLLRDRIGRLEEMVAAVHLMIEAEHMHLELTPEERFELFGDFDVDSYAAEARERWGETDAYKEARRRTGLSASTRAHSSLMLGLCASASSRWRPCLRRRSWRGLPATPLRCRG
jgi:MerR family transcriptional regulator, thiopeptide resistance regulator